MTSPALEIDSREPCYRVGTVAQLTGLSPDTIRAWERRYATVAPRRSAGGTRLYSDEDVVRLQLMKALTDCGDAIGAIAGDAGTGAKYICRIKIVSEVCATMEFPSSILGKFTRRTFPDVFERFGIVLWCHLLLHFPDGYQG